VRVSVQNKPAAVEPSDTEDPTERLRSALVLTAFLAASAFVVWFGTEVSRADALGWYATAQKSPLFIPFWLTSSLWTVLQVMVAVAAWLVWRERQRRRVSGALSLYVTQLALIAMWRPVLLSLYPKLGETALLLAVVIMVLLILTMITMVREFWHVNRAAALMLVPYLLWALYALHANIALIVLN
jgi:benzodiazapine receptor